MTHHEHGEHGETERRSESFDARMEDFQGRVKKAAGELFDDEELRDEGRLDRMASSVRDTLNGFVDSAKDFVRSDDDTDR